MKTFFEELTQKVLSTRKQGEHFLLSIAGEKSQFIRFNGSKVRQIGSVEDATFEMTLILEKKREGQDQDSELRRASRGLTVSGLMWQDWERVQAALALLRQEVPELPVDPYAELPIAPGKESSRGSSTSHSYEGKGELLPSERVIEKLLSGNAKKLDLAGIYAAGPIFRGMANSAGQKFWFSTETFSFDYSVYTKTQRALKATYAGTHWSDEEYESQLESASQRIQILEKPAKKVARGTYRTYLAPAALSDIIAMMSWGGVSEASLRQGDSPLRLVRQGEKSFSPLFTLAEDFTSGQVPRFNDLGEIAEERLPIIEKGILKNTLVSSRSAKEYGLISNGAVLGETLRSPVVNAGDLEEKDILKRIDTGLYLSQLHYLNWSDQPGGRMTGMTRYACFWVEHGQIVAPIENMRWDDTLFTLLGSKLEALTQSRSTLSDVGTYERRMLGGTQVPGALVSEMVFTI